MNERLIPIFNFQLSSQADADGVAGVYVPEAMLVVGVSIFATIAGSPATATLDLQDDTTDIETGIDISSDGYTEFSTPHHVAAGSVLEADANLSDGTSPTISGNFTFWGYVAE